MSYFDMDISSMEKVLNKVEQFADRREAESVISEYLWEQGGKLIKESIHKILPVSGRKAWNGKKAAAKSTDPFTEDHENLSVTVKAKGYYHYLYFPDDGSNTVHHYGNQQFMYSGAENVSEEIGNEIVKKLIEKMEV